MSYFMFTVSSWHESSRPEVLCISGSVRLSPSSASGGRSSDNVGWRPGGSIRHCSELTILWVIDRFKKKRIGWKNRFGFDKCVLTCCRIYDMLLPEFCPLINISTAIYLHASRSLSPVGLFWHGWFINEKEKYPLMASDLSLFNESFCNFGPKLTSMSLSITELWSFEAFLLLMTYSNYY